MNNSPISGLDSGRNRRTEETTSALAEPAIDLADQGRQPYSPTEAHKLLRNAARLLGTPEVGRVGLRLNHSLECLRSIIRGHGIGDAECLVKVLHDGSAANAKVSVWGTTLEEGHLSIQNIAENTDMFLLTNAQGNHVEQVDSRQFRAVKIGGGDSERSVRYRDTDPIKTVGVLTIPLRVGFTATPEGVNHDAPLIAGFLSMKTGRNVSDEVFDAVEDLVHSYAFHLSTLLTMQYALRTRAA